MTSTLWQDGSLYSTRSKSFSVSISRSTIHAPHWKVKRRGGDKPRPYAFRVQMSYNETFLQGEA